MAEFFKASRKNSAKNKIIKNVRVEKLDHQGLGIAYFQDNPLFVEGGLPEELLDVQILESKKRYSKGLLTKINQASASRIDPRCPHYNECGGCHLQHVSQPTQIEIKSEGLQSLFKRFAKHITESLVEPIVDQAWGYRRTARFGLQFSKKSKQLQMGFRRSATNDLIDQKVCPVLVPELEQLITPTKELLSNLQGKADLGHIELILADQGVVILLRHLKTLSNKDIEAITDFAQQQQVTFIGQNSKHQLIKIAGSDTLSYQLNEGALTLTFTATDFLQVNANINQKMVKQAVSWLQLDETDQVLDLFCGLGNFTLPIAMKAASVVGVEGIQKMVDRATLNAQSNQLSNCQFYQADLSADNLKKQPWSLQHFNKILLDPARAGAQDCMEFVVANKPTHIVYVSCDPLTLARDSQILLEKGYKLAKLGLIDMFPQTKHMESMALFIK